jgi:hypothetical protein
MYFPKIYPEGVGNVKKELGQDSRRRDRGHSKHKTDVPRTETKQNMTMYPKVSELAAWRENC